MAILEQEAGHPKYTQGGAEHQQKRMTGNNLPEWNSSKHEESPMRRGDPEGHGDHQKKNTEEQRIENRKTLGQELINRPGGVGRTLTRHGTEKRHRKRSGSSAVTGTNQQSNYGPRENIWMNKGTGSGPRGPILRGRGGRPRGIPTEVETGTFSGPPHET